MVHRHVQRTTADTPRLRPGATGIEERKIWGLPRTGGVTIDRPNASPVLLKKVGSSKARRRVRLVKKKRTVTVESRQKTA